MRGVCGRKPTHVILLNTPDDDPYVVSSCREHREIDGGFKYVTLRRFEKALAKARAAGVPEGIALADAVAEELEPELFCDNGDDADGNE
jgi:hypothetical protein